MKKRLALFLTAVLLLSLPTTQPAAAADTAVAAALRLVSTEGTVALTNENGRALTLRDDMKLYSGYGITTSTASYAYLSLDDTKAVKLDASTTAEVKKNGKKLEVLVNSGKIFFNVTAPLAADETMEVRTSTMVTGIRGTAGVMDSGKDASVLYLLDGTVSMDTVDPVTGKLGTITIAAGQSATATRATASDGTTGQTVAVARFSAEELPGFAAAEIAKDSALQAKIAGQTTLDVAAIVDKAQETLSSDQALQAELHKAVTLALGTQKDSVSRMGTSTEKPDRDDNSGGGGGSGGSGGSSGSGSISGGGDIGGGGGPSIEPILKGNVTLNDLRAVLAMGDTVRLQVGEESAASYTGLTIDNDFDLPVGKTLIVEHGAQVAVDASRALRIYGKVFLEEQAHFVNHGVVSVFGEYGLWIGGTYSNQGLATLETARFTGQDSANTGSISIAVGGMLENGVGGTLLLAEPGSRLSNAGSLMNAGNLTLGRTDSPDGRYCDAILMNRGTLTNSDTINNYGQIQNHNAMTMTGTLVVGSKGTGGSTMQPGAIYSEDDGAMTFAAGSTFIMNNGVVSQKGTLEFPIGVTFTYHFGTFRSEAKSVLTVGGQAPTDWPVLGQNGSFVTGESFQKIVENIPPSDVSSTLTLLGNYTTSTGFPVQAGQNIILDLASYTLGLDQVNIMNQGTFTMTGTENGALVMANAINNLGTFTMAGGSLSYSSLGPAVQNHDSATMTMTGGRITATLGSGVSLADTATFTMTGGDVFSENVNDPSVVGVEVGSGTRFTMSGGTVSSKHGKGVTVADGATFELSEGAVSSDGGSGVVLASSQGGTVATFIMSGGTVSSKNETAENMCGVDVGSGTRFEMLDGTVSSQNGNSVIVADNATFALSGGSIFNEAGSGVVLALGSGAGAVFTMTGGSVSCTGDNGVTMADTTEFTMTGGSVSCPNGNGVRMAGNTMFTMSDGSISCDATNGGTYYAVNNASSSSFYYSGGMVKAMGQNAVCKSIPTDGPYTVSNVAEDGYYFLTLKPAS